MASFRGETYRSMFNILRLAVGRVLDAKPNKADAAMMNLIRVFDDATEFSSKTKDGGKA